MAIFVVKKARIARRRPVFKDFDESKHPRDDHGRFTIVFRGIWGPDKPHELSGGIETYSADRAVAESYATEPNDSVLLQEAGGKMTPQLITAELRPKQMFRFGSEPRPRIDEIAERLRLDEDEQRRLIDDLDQFNEKDNPRFQNWEYGDSKVFHSLLRDRGYDAIEMPGAHVDRATNTTTHPIEYRILAPSAIRRTGIESVAVGKATSVDELDRLLAQDDRITAQVRQTYLDAIQRLGDAIDTDRIAELLRQGRTQEAINQINAQSVAAGFAPVADAIIAATVGVARSQAELATQNSGIQFTFSQVNPEAVSYLQSYEMDLIREMTSDALESVRTAINAGVAAGDNPITIARDVRQYIGLTARQTQAVLNYRRLLQSRDGQALNRQLRDRRFDPSLRRHIAGDRALSSDKIDTMVERYRQRYLKYRSETIARTEAKRALGSGNQLVWNQAVTANRVDEDQVTKKWLTVGDHKVRPAHQELDGQVVGLNEPFTCSEGEIMYPGDPGADPGLTINCRCTAVYRFKVKE